MSFSEDDETNYRRLFGKITSGWPWFVFSILLFLGLGILYIRYTVPQYNIYAQLMISDVRKGTGAGNDMLSELGVSATSSVENEAEVLKTNFLMEQVVRDMELNVIYYTRGALRSDEMYSPPFHVEITKPDNLIRTTLFDVVIINNDKLSIESPQFTKEISFGEMVNVPGVGHIRIMNNRTLLKPGAEFKFSISSIDNAVARIKGGFEITLISKSVSIINLNLLYPNPFKGQDILNKLINIYIKTNVDDRNRVADSSYIFIQRRLNYLRGELGSLEGNILTFKQKNQIAEMNQQSSVIIQNSNEYINDLAKVETQLSVLNSITDYINNNVKGGRIVPSSLIVSDPLFSDLVEKYNGLLMERERRLTSVNESNPVIVNMDNMIAGLRTDMLSSLNSTRRTLEISRSRITARTRQAEGQVREVPQLERNYLEMARQQKIKQDLYIFLMQKGEETAIAKTYNTPNSKNIEPPKADASPVSPKKMIIYVMSVIFGTILPALVIYARFLLNTKVDSKDDISRATQVPIIGEISHSPNAENLQVVKNSRSAISEQFRGLRTSLSFYLKPTQGKVILLTSSISGEGKSFISLNLASILALSDKKVLIMELDLRKPGVSLKINLTNVVGFSNYIIDESIKPKDIIKELNDIMPNLYLISSGAIPPNPAELLMHPRTELLMKELIDKFDYIIIDAPPVGLVTDAQLLSSYADMCIYVLRQKYSAKDKLHIIEDLRKDGQMKKIGIVINDIKHEAGSGYGYGYGYYSEHDQELGLMDKIRNFFKRN